MFVEDNGDIRDEDYSLTLEGIFWSVDEGVEALYSEESLFRREHDHLIFRYDCH